MSWFILAVAFLFASPSRAIESIQPDMICPRLQLSGQDSAGKAYLNQFKVCFIPPGQDSPELAWVGATLYYGQTPCGNAASTSCRPHSKAAKSAYPQHVYLDFDKIKKAPQVTNEESYLTAAGYSAHSSAAKLRIRTDRPVYVAVTYWKRTAPPNGALGAPQESEDFQEQFYMPTMPQGLTANALSPHEVELRWEPSTTPGQIWKYLIYRKGVDKEIGEVEGTTFRDSGLEPGRLYTYEVQALDSAMTTNDKGEPIHNPSASARSAPASATTPKRPAIAAATPNLASPTGLDHTTAASVQPSTPRPFFSAAAAVDGQAPARAPRAEKNSAGSRKNPAAPDNYDREITHIFRPIIVRSQPVLADSQSFQNLSNPSWDSNGAANVAGGERPAVKVPQAPGAARGGVGGISLSAAPGISISAGNRATAPLQLRSTPAAQVPAQGSTTLPAPEAQAAPQFESVKTRVAQAQAQAADTSGARIEETASAGVNLMSALIGEPLAALQSAVLAPRVEVAQNLKASQTSASPAKELERQAFAAIANTSTPAVAQPSQAAAQETRAAASETAQAAALLNDQGRAPAKSDPAAERRDLPAGESAALAERALEQTPRYEPAEPTLNAQEAPARNRKFVLWLAAIALTGLLAVSASFLARGFTQGKETFQSAAQATPSSVQASATQPFIAPAQAPASGFKWRRNVLRVAAAVYAGSHRDAKERPLEAQASMEPAGVPTRPLYDGPTILRKENPLPPTARGVEIPPTKGALALPLSPAASQPAAPRALSLVEQTPSIETPVVAADSAQKTLSPGRTATVASRPPNVELKFENLNGTWVYVLYRDGVRVSDGVFPG